MREDRCRLCYGKLKKHICVDCGLDNSKSDAMYILNNNGSNDRLETKFQDSSAYQRSTKAKTGHSNIPNQYTNKRSSKKGSTSTISRTSTQKNSSSLASRTTNRTSNTYGTTGATGTNNAYGTTKTTGTSNAYGTTRTSNTYGTTGTTGTSNTYGTTGTTNTYGDGSGYAGKSTYQGNQTTIPNVPRRTPQGAYGTGKKKKSLGGLIFLVFIIFGFLSSAIENGGSFFDEIKEGFEDFTDIEPAIETNDPYEYVEKTFDENSGSNYKMELTAGVYQVGVDIPEGLYMANLISGMGGFSIDDPDSNIFDYQNFSDDTEFEGITELEDIRLFTGGTCTLNGNATLLLQSENARVDLFQERKKSGNLPTVSFESQSEDGENPTILKVPEAVAEGVYDVFVESEMAYMQVNRKPDENGYEESIFVNISTDTRFGVSESFRNLEFMEGDQIKLFMGKVRLEEAGK